MTLGIGLVRARFDARISLSELDPPRSLVLAGRGVGALGAAEGRGTVTLQPTPSGTRLDYAYESSVNGTLAAVGGRMLEGAAKVVLQQLFRALGRVAAAPSTSVRQPERARATATRTWWQRLRAWLRTVA